jgi:hypothetical protein
MEKGMLEITMATAPEKAAEGLSTFTPGSRVKMIPR